METSQMPYVFMPMSLCKMNDAIYDAALAYYEGLRDDEQAEFRAKCIRASGKRIGRKQVCVFSKNTLKFAELYYKETSIAIWPVLEVTRNVNDLNAGAYVWLMVFLKSTGLVAGWEPFGRCVKHFSELEWSVQYGNDRVCDLPPRLTAYYFALEQERRYKLHGTHRE